MARLNPRRRRLNAQAKLFREIVSAHGPAHDDSFKLQQGPVKAGLDKLVKGVSVKDQVRVSAPRGVSLSPAWVDVGGRMKYQGDKGKLSSRRPKASDYKG